MEKNEAFNHDEQQVQAAAKKKRRGILIGAGVAAVAVVAVAVAGAVFKPWLLFVDREVNEDIPQVVAMRAMEKTAEGKEGKEGNEVTLVKQGEFISHEHSTKGTASLVKDEKTGNYQVVLTGLETSNGPDVHVWLSKAPVVEGKDGWFVAGKHEHLDLGAIKGNRGNQVYEVLTGAMPESAPEPAPEQWTSVVLWCDDFNVSFGAAELKQQS
ncbi:MAG: DM13 domain-containing protein [Corynebacterium sp.]|uniref:DM13 domain-containing protein n=1 Tax=Corynebacterium sp. TaxID=1720 RepID=UPI0026DAB92B|nr:DM13 domain-containing protein [Corynebacterium sp.]MDO5028994.1 DM13 domain-containing protein [Corynebacterium sp.]